MQCWSTGTDAVVECVGQRDVSSYRPPATRRRDVTTVCRLSRSDDVTAVQARQQRNVATTLLRLQHQPTLVC